MKGVQSQIRRNELSFKIESEEVARVGQQIRVFLPFEFEIVLYTPYPTIAISRNLANHISTFSLLDINLSPVLLSIYCLQKALFLCLC